MKLFEKMNHYLANQQIMYIKLHNIHWYIEGPSFFVLHEKTEELYGITADIIDEVAERLLALGQKPVASMKKALEMTAVKELEDRPICAEEAIHQLVTDIQYWMKDTKELIRLSEEEKDCVSADMFTGYLKEYEKLLWMIRAYTKTAFQADK